MPRIERNSSPIWFIVLSALLCHIPLSAYADTKVLTAEGTYTMGDGETPRVAELKALQQAKRMAIEQAGTYVQSYAKVKQYDLVADEMETVSAGIIEVEVLEKNRKVIGEGIQFYVKIKATVRPEKADELIARIKQKGAGVSPDFVGDYRRLQNDYARLASELDTLKRQMAELRDAREQQPVVSRIAELERQYQATERYERCQDLGIRATSTAPPSRTGYKSTVKCLDEVIRLDPTFAEAWGMRAFYREGLGEREGSIADYTEAIRLDPQPTWYHWRSMMFMGSNKLDRALMDINEAIRLDPNSSELYSTRGDFLYMRADSSSRGDFTNSRDIFSKALSDYTNAIRLNARTYKDDPIWGAIVLANDHEHRGKTYARLLQHEPAIEDLTKALQLLDSPKAQTASTPWGKSVVKATKIDALRERSEQYCLLGRKDEAWRDIREFCSLLNTAECHRTC